MEERDVRRIEVEATDLEALLVEWLNELTYRFEIDEMVFKALEIQELDDTHLKAICRGEKFNAERRRLSIGPKAATYHMLELRENTEGSGWQAKVILDI